MHLQWKEEKAGQGWDGGGNWGIESWDRGEEVLRVGGGLDGGWYCDPHLHRMAAHARVVQKSY